MSQRRSRDESHPAPDAGSRRTQQRPASIGELAEQAMKFHWDSAREFKHCLRMAERSRNQARAFQDKGDLEGAFIHYARAASIALEKMPTHPHYRTALTEAQRENLGWNGQEILDCMSRIKPALVDRFTEWRAAHPDQPLLPLFDEPPDQNQPANHNFAQAMEDELAEWKKWREGSDRQPAETNVKRQSSRHRNHPQHQVPLDRRKDDAINSARQAAGPPVYRQPTADYSFSQHPNPVHGHGSQSTIVVMPPPATDKREREEKRRIEQEGFVRRQQEAEAEARQIRQTIAVNNSLPHGPQLQQLQQGSSTLSAHSSASSVTTNGSSPMFPHTQASSVVTTPASSFYHVPPSSSMPPQPVIHPPPPNAPPALSMPGQAPPHTPIRAQGSSQTPSGPLVVDQQPYPGSESPTPSFLFPGSSFVDLHRTPTRANLRNQEFFSTTSPPPQDAKALFPSLMSPHQQRQGYYPSHNSMFIAMDRLTLNDTTNTTPTSYNASNIYASADAQPRGGWAFGSQESNKSAAAAAAAQIGQRLMDGGGKLKGSKYNVPAPPPPPPPLPHPHHQVGENAPGSSAPFIPMPPPPPTSAIAASGRPFHHSQSQPQHRTKLNKSNHSNTNSSNYPGSSPEERKLKTVILPRETLPRFLAIASLNTEMNRETCGLFLGREVWLDDDDDDGDGKVPSYDNRDRDTAKGKKKQKEKQQGGEGGEGEGRSEYFVTTLLIPKQRGTSDTCTMDGEELVLKFVEERSLITLGWIHTHPSQSCFMSSVDLHTHSGFQLMLPESVAVVCAPKSNPNFGIFRLTDPPGLPTILKCKEKESFHPHPDLPIYTDADKGHVSMRDAPLEIIDLR